MGNVISETFNTIKCCRSEIVYEIGWIIHALLDYDCLVATDASSMRHRLIYTSQTRHLHIRQFAKAVCLATHSNRPTVGIDS
jgi:hypothetical protein